MEHLIYAIDLGSKNISAVIAQYDELEPFGLKVRAAQSTPAKGIRRGMIFDEGDVARTVNALIQGMEKTIKKNDSAKCFYCLSISGLAVSTESCQYSISIGETSAIDDVKIHRLTENARSKFYIEDDRSIIRLNAISYDVDNFRDVASPKGLSSSQLSGRFLFTLAQNKAKDTLMKLLKKPSDTVSLYPLASAKAAILVPTEDLRNGVMLLDLGAQTTNMAVFRNERLCYEASIPFGSDLITKDLSSMMNFTPEYAEFLRNGLGMGTQIKSSAMEIDNNKIDIELYKLTIRARLEEMMAYVDSEIESSKYRRYIKKIYITGGGARMIGITDFLSEFLDIPTSICNTSYKIEDAQVQQLAGALGMASLFARENRDKLIEQQTDIFGQIQDNQVEENIGKTDTPELETDQEEKKKGFLDRFTNLFSSNEGDKTLEN